MQTILKEPICYFLTKINTFTAEGNTLLLDGLFEAQKEVKFQSVGNGFGSYGDKVKDDVHIHCRLEIGSMEFDDMSQHIRSTLKMPTWILM